MAYIISMETKGHIIIHFEILDLENISSTILFGDDLNPNEIEKISQHLLSQKKIKRQSEVMENMLNESKRQSEEMINMMNKG